ncbi:MAG: hypothetical protein ACI8UO_003882 [Verrucomicrobiales bacterium]|jgi:hypothetical protein
MASIRLLTILCLLSSSVVAEIAVLPEEFTLAGPEARQQLLVVEKLGEEIGARVADAEFTSSNPDIVAIENGIAVAKGNGSATITAKTGERSAQAKIVVSNFEQSHAWSFRNHVLPVISKSDCNTGGCHGAVAGKGGFRLSLAGYNPERDFYTMAREARGRRIEPSAPAYSLVLTKPTTAAKHKGGKRLDPRSRDYRVFSEWIADGAVAPTDDDARLERLEILPEISTLKPDDGQQLLVTAVYSNGRREDVTSWAKFDSADKTVANVDSKTGEIDVIGYGEGAITAWFSSQIVIARITSPYPNKIPDAVFAEAPKRNLIDEINLAQLQNLNLKPSPRTTDAEFIRRAFIDTIGMLPTPAETREFLADADSNKRDRLIEELLSRPEFVDYWTYRWGDVFLMNGRLLRPDAVKAYYDWLRAGVENNTPWDELVRDVVTAKGGSLENGATNFYAVHQEPETMAENVSQAFMTLSIGCAKCHNHPLEKWTNDQYYAFANLFARVRAKGWGGDPRNGDGVRTVYIEPRGDLIQPRTGVAQQPAPLDAEPIDQDATADRRVVLAEWLTSPENPYFTRSITNRVWAAYFGIGLVEPVEDLRASNPASNEQLLGALAEFVAANDYDLKALMRLILQSETYQRSSESLPENADESRYFSRNYPRRLMAEVLHDAVADITNVPTEFNNVGLADGSNQETKFYPKGTRAMQLYDSAIRSYFLKTFGRNERAITCDCERSNQPSMVQVLHLSNGDTLNEKLRSEESRLQQLLKMEGTKVIEEAYFLALSRTPTERELKEFEEVFAATPAEEKRLAIEDLFWSLMTSREFLFQH